MSKKDVYNLTNPQNNIYQVEQTSREGSPINHITSVLKLDGNLDANLLDKTLNKIIEVNDSFRLKFIEKDGVLSQYIEDYTYTPIKVVTLDKDDVEEFIKDFKKLEITIKNPFNFTVVLTPSCSFVFYKSHHIIADAWGMTQVAEQIKEIYTMLADGEDLSTYTKPSYRTLIEREQKYFESKKYDIDANFWSDYVKKIDTTRPFNNVDIFDKKATRFEYALDDALFKQISDFCAEKGITDYSFFLAIVAVYFNKLFSQKSIVFGTPFLNRQKRLGELECTGLHVSTLPLNINIAEEVDFIALCKIINSSNLSIYKHSGFPYNKIQELYNKYNNSTSRLFDIGFSYQINKLTNSLSSQDSGVCSWFYSGEQNEPLTIHLSTLNNYKVIFYDYLNSCFTDTEIKKTNEIILSLIDQVLNKTTVLKDIVPITKSDIDAIASFNATGDLKKLNLTVLDIFEDIIKQYPKKIAVVCGDTSITYSDLSKRINALASFLISKGITLGTPVALFFDKSIDMLIAMFATLKAGGCYVPVLPAENPDRIHYILSDCKPKCIITHKDYDIQINYVDNIINLDKISLDTTRKSPKVNITPDTTAYIIYTSGSTGNPKGSMITHRNICNLKVSIENDYVLKASNTDVSMSLLKYSFDASGIDIYTSLLFGGKLVMVPKEDELNPEKVLGIIESQKVTRSFLIPKWIERIALQDEQSEYDLTSLKILGTGGETLRPYILENLLSKYSNLKILNLYGPTEATMFTTYKPVSVYEVKNNHTSIGKPIYGARIAIVNEFGEFMPIGKKGELVIYEDDTSISNIAKGYLNLPQQTANRFVKIYNPILKKEVKAYRTGDIAKINQDLELEFFGRSDDVVKINGGYLVALNEVERRISETLGNDFIVCPVAVPYQNTKIIILFVKQLKTSIPLNTIKTYINSNISFYMRPKKILSLDDFPRNSSGKIDRIKLGQMAEKYLLEHKNKTIEPKTKTEKELYEIVRKHVDIQEISTTDDFIDDLGIDSLTITSIHTALNAYNVSIQDLYNNSTIRDLAGLIDNSHSREMTPDLSNLQDAEILNNVKKFDIHTVLITGVTGFLGIHILHNLLLNSDVKKIYCIIRNRINLPGKKRLENAIDFYFNSNNELLDLIREKVVILNGDTSKHFLGLDRKTYASLQEEVSTVINSAANVKHFEKPAQTRKDNVVSVNNLIEFCQDKISLAHISTLSIAGFSNDGSENKVFSENSLYIGQQFNNNPYLISKFEAEKNLLIATNKSGLNATIFRLGNIMPRYSDGAFQKNFSQNVFLSALHAIIKSSVIATDLNDLNIEFSPVDECAKMIVELILNGKPNSIYHILNDKEISVFEFKTLLKYLNYDLVDVDFKTFMKEVEKNSDQYTKEYILSTNINKFSQDITLTELHSMGLDWSRIDINYLSHIINIIKNFK